MVGERHIKGYVASRGYAAGPIHVLAEVDMQSTASTGTPEEEAGKLKAALAGAGEDLTLLLDGLEDDDAAGIVEFQIAMLEDEELFGPALTAIAAGKSAHEGWRDCMNAAVEDYRSSDDSYFAERATDLVDMRDRVLRALAGIGETEISPGTIVVANDLSPTRFLTTDWSGCGVALHGGSPTAHVAILARARGVPMIVGLNGTDAPVAGDGLLDAENGVLIVSPRAETRRRFEQDWKGAREQAVRDRVYLDKPALTAAGNRVKTYINCAQPADLEALDPAHCDGVGLVRTEFLFEDGAALPTEDEQYEDYRRIVDWADGRPVTLRTLDAGGDKPIAGVTIDGESNPFLGVRGIRLSLMDPPFFKQQLRAMLRASAHGPVKIMVPMVTAPSEMAAVRDMLDEAASELRAAGKAIGSYQLGMMVEVPSAAISVEEFDCDFYSIGSNDLVQYVTACGRDNPALNHLARPDASAVLSLIRHVAGFGASKGREVSVCGDMAGDPAYVPKLLDCGIDALSMAPTALARVKGVIARHGEDAA
ncbi:phosphoenolpyruvate--protein phosphotransferase [Hwanghaeella sp.]|uniref:phosphoenolpyruvate--protein phosphotransferase n=1 Tax=Hwanghaeella sp. TaxID=2605943 RepID=UPI003CCB863F